MRKYNEEKRLAKICRACRWSGELTVCLHSSRKFLNMRCTFLRVPIIRIEIFWRPYWGPLSGKLPSTASTHITCCACLSLPIRSSRIKRRRRRDRRRRTVLKPLAASAHSHVVASTSGIYPFVSLYPSYHIMPYIPYIPQDLPTYVPQYIPLRSQPLEKLPDLRHD